MSRRSPTGVLALVTMSVCLALSLRARAGEPASAPAPASGPSRQGTTRTGPESEATPVDIVLVGVAATEGALGARIRSWFGPTAVLSVTTEPNLVAERVLGPLPVRRVAVWVTLRSPREARLYFAVAGETHTATRYLLRDVPLDHGLDELGSESVAQVVHSSVSALTEGSVPLAERPEMERVLADPASATAFGATTTAPTPATPHAPGKPVTHPHARTVSNKSRRGPVLSPRFGAFYRVALAGDEGLAHGPGLALGAAFVFDAYRVGAVARGQYVVPRSEPFEDLTLTFRGAWARLGVGGERALGRAWRLGLALGVGLDWVHYDPEASTTAELAPGARGTDRRPFEFVSLGVSRALGPLRVGGRVELGLYPVRAHYDAQGEESSRELGESSRLQPGFVLELLFD